MKMLLLTAVVVFCDALWLNISQATSWAKDRILHMTCERICKLQIKLPILFSSFWKGCWQYFVFSIFGIMDIRWKQLHHKLLSFRIQPLGEKVASSCFNWCSKQGSRWERLHSHRGFRSFQIKAAFVYVLSVAATTRVRFVVVISSNLPKCVSPLNCNVYVSTWQWFIICGMRLCRVLSFLCSFVF